VIKNNLVITDLGVLCAAIPPLEKEDLEGFKKASNYPQIPYNQDFLLWFPGSTQRAQQTKWFSIDCVEPAAIRCVRCVKPFPEACKWFKPLKALQETPRGGT
jgi:hypothetical protein